MTEFPTNCELTQFEQRVSFPLCKMEITSISGMFEALDKMHFQCLIVPTQSKDKIIDR